MMKKIIPFLSFFLILVQCNGQNDSKNSIVKYQYKFDSYFTKNRKLIRHLDTLIPKLFTELNNSRTCGGNKCNPDFTMELLVNPIIWSRNYSPDAFSSSSNIQIYKHITDYSISGILLLRNKEGNAVKYFKFLDTSAIFHYETKKQFGSVANSFQKIYINVVDPITGVATQQLRYIETDNTSPLTSLSEPSNYFKNPKNTDPKQNDLFRIVEIQLLSIRLIKE